MGTGVLRRYLDMVQQAQVVGEGMSAEDCLREAKEVASIKNQIDKSKL